MEWYVYRYDFNKKEIVKYNVFDHWKYKEDVQKLLKKRLPYEEFSEQLKRETMYYFWTKYEYEVVVTTFPIYINRDEMYKINKEYEKEIKFSHVTPEIGIKIDIYEQIKMNWDRFVDYVCSFKNKRKNIDE